MHIVYFSVGRLESEISEVLGDRDHVTIEDLEKLQYTEQVGSVTY